MSYSSRTIISVIIPTLNEAEMIGQCLAYLAASEFPQESLEVIVSDNGSIDATAEIAASYSDRLKVRVLRNPKINVSALRNLGAHTAEGEILAFLDADCLVPPDWLANAVQLLDLGQGVVIGGHIRIPQDSSWVARAWYGAGYAPKDGEMDYVPSGNMLMRREIFRAIHGFDENLRTAEDFDLCLRAKRCGFVVRGAARMAVVHLRTPQSLGEFYKRERWHGTHVTRALFSNIQQWSSFRAVGFALAMLFCSVGLLAGCVDAISTGRLRLFVAAATLTLAICSGCAALKLARRKTRPYWSRFCQLTVLHLVYGFARARALVSISVDYPRRHVRPNPIAAQG